MEYEQLVERARAGWPARIILTAVELGVADALDTGPSTAEEAAARMGTDPRATGLLLDACTALGLVEKDGERYANSALFRESLVTSSPSYAGAGLMHHAHLWRRWADLTEVVRTGKPAGREEERAEVEYHHFVRAMYDFGWSRAKALAKSLDLSERRRMLDLGGGPGSYAIAFCERNPELRAVVYDRPLALDVATDIVKRHGMEGRISLQAGDFLVDEIGTGYDLLLVSQIIHSFDEAENRMILGKARAALSAGGKLLLLDFFLDEGRTSPPQAAVFAVNMLVNTPGGRTYTWAEAEAWLGDAGFEAIRRQELPGPGGLIVATIPEMGKPS